MWACGAQRVGRAASQHAAATRRGDPKDKEYFEPSLGYFWVGGVKEYRRYRGARWSCGRTLFAFDINELQLIRIDALGGQVVFNIVHSFAFHPCA